MKPKVLITVLTGYERHNWPNSFLTMDLLKMQRDTRWNVEVEMIRDIAHHDTARNTAIVAARKARADYLWMLDNDNSFSPNVPNPMDHLTDAANHRLDVFALPYMRFEGRYGIQPTMRGNTYGTTENGAWIDIDKVSTGTMAIARRVWETIPGPWFTFEHDGTELNAITVAESFNFCRLARSHGFKVWASTRGAGHWRTGELSQMRMAYQPAGPDAWQEPRADLVAK